VLDKLRTSGEPKHFHQVGAMCLNRAHGDEQLLGELLVGIAEREEPQHVAFTLGERIGIRCSAPSPLP
jgi:hypothetical protein